MAKAQVGRSGGFAIQQLMGVVCFRFLVSADLHSTQALQRKR
jgi:hypothetical protein